MNKNINLHEEDFYAYNIFSEAAFYIKFHEFL